MKNYELLLEMQKLAGMITEQELNEMARPSTPFSRALNDLITKNPSITTAEIRKQLSDLGIEPPANLSVRINHMRKFVADKQGAGKQEDGEAKAVVKKEPAQLKENNPAPKKTVNIKNVTEFTYPVPKGAVVPDLADPKYNHPVAGYSQTPFIDIKDYAKVVDNGVTWTWPAYSSIRMRDLIKKEFPGLMGVTVDGKHQLNSTISIYKTTCDIHAGYKSSLTPEVIKTATNADQKLALEITTNGKLIDQESGGLIKYYTHTVRGIKYICSVTLSSDRHKSEGVYYYEIYSPYIK